MWYRALESLRFTGSSRRLEAGAIDDLKKSSPKAIKLLIAKNRIAPVIAPPLAILPGFKGEKAEAYAKQGVVSIQDMTGDEDDFDEALKWSTGEHDSPDASRELYEVDNET